MFRHFSSLSITPADLRKKYAGRRGLWLAFSAPRRDETGHQSPLGYYEGRFEDVLQAILHAHRREFLDESMCGEVIPISPQIVGERPWARDPEPAELFLRRRGWGCYFPAGVWGHDRLGERRLSTAEAVLNEAEFLETSSSVAREGLLE